MVIGGLGRCTAGGLAGAFAVGGGFGGAESVGLGAGFDDVCVEGDSVDDRGDEAGVGEDGSPLAEGQVGPDPDGGFFVSFGDDLEEQFGAAGVDVDVAEFVDLCGYPHRLTYADTATMPRMPQGGSRSRDGGGLVRRSRRGCLGIVAG